MVAAVQPLQKQKILVVESDPEVAIIVRLWLERGGYEVEAVHDGFEALRHFYREQPDMIVLETALPYIDGWEVCNRVREVSDVPMMIISAGASIKDRLRGFECGADEYITKPFDFREMLARVKAILRRSVTVEEQKKSTMNFGDLRIDLHNRAVYVRGTQIDLSPIEFRLLSCLVKNEGRAMSPRQLLVEVWGPRYIQKTSYVKVYIQHLRKKIEESPSSPKYILTERDLGYRFVKAVDDRSDWRSEGIRFTEPATTEVDDMDEIFSRLRNPSRILPIASRKATLQK